MSPQHRVVAADAGGGTLDISSYAIKDASPLLSLIEEIALHCTSSFSLSVRPKPTIFLSRVSSPVQYSSAAEPRYLLEHKPQGPPRYSAPAVLGHIAKWFDETAKRLFGTRAEDRFLPFGSHLDKGSSLGTHVGKLRRIG